MIVFRRIESQNYIDIRKFINLRKKSLIEDVGYFNLMTYPEEEESFTIQGYKNYNFLGNYFVLERGSVFIGYVAFKQEWVNNCQGNHNFSLGPLFVLKNYRGKGYGKLLMTEIVNFIMENHKEFPVIKLNLSVNTNSKIPIYMYKKLGFKKVGINKGYIKTKDGKFIDVLIMSKIVKNNYIKKLSNGYL